MSPVQAEQSCGLVRLPSIGGVTAIFWKSADVFCRLIIGQEHHYITNGNIYIYKYYIYIINIYVKHGIPHIHISYIHMACPNWLDLQPGLGLLIVAPPSDADVVYWTENRQCGNDVFLRSQHSMMSDHCIDFIWFHMISWSEIISSTFSPVMCFLFLFFSSWKSTFGWTSTPRNFPIEADAGAAQRAKVTGLNRQLCPKVIH